MRKRTPKKDDQEKVQEAYELLMELIQENQHRIEPALWMGAMISALANNFEYSNIPHCEFKKSINEAVDFYFYP